MAEDEIVLKPCPFCGGKAFLYSTSYATYIKCEKLHAKGSERIDVMGITRERAARKWNKAVESVEDLKRERGDGNAAE